MLLKKQQQKKNKLKKYYSLFLMILFMACNTSDKPYENNLDSLNNKVDSLTTVSSNKNN